MFGSRRTRAPAVGMGGGGYGAAPPRRRGFGMGGGRRGAGGCGAQPMGGGMGGGRTGGMGMTGGGVAPRVRTRDRIKRLFGFGRSRRRTMY
ncbi:hypothetical protein RSOLAG1IB_00356 [Rhizoctonia solani AG-1 IB]|uniref:Uncharacterized protein n=1 Tax=Thanatephorus cucumeris (strain AG1-IB / isolate 7/3/14) TaxID=1108050 RepID=A0A0B7F195_THACB|nr:hypothetical protein RSOLAG1IB_00356 [Rhizoctonia solani AG-1 IB]